MDFFIVGLMGFTVILILVGAIKTIFDFTDKADKAIDSAIDKIGVAKNKMGKKVNKMIDNHSSSYNEDLDALKKLQSLYDQRTISKHEFDIMKEKIIRKWE